MLGRNAHLSIAFAVCWSVRMSRNDVTLEGEPASTELPRAERWEWKDIGAAIGNEGVSLYLGGEDVHASYSV